MTRPALTTVIVSCGLDRMLEHCLRDLERALLARADRSPDDVIVVVDNASPRPYGRPLLDRHAARLLRFDAPVSFACACNEGVRAHPNANVLLLNNDLLLDPDAVGAMEAVLEADPDVGICGLRLLFPDATIQHGGVGFGPDAVGPIHWARGRRAEDVPRADRECQAVTGACLLCRGAVWERLGGLDESYPFGLEDVDLCLRARARGIRIVCCHQAEGLHFESMTPGRVEKDRPSRKLFMERWRGRYVVDGGAPPEAPEPRRGLGARLRGLLGTVERDTTS